jgi:hypothetical protein
MKATYIAKQLILLGLCICLCTKSFPIKSFNVIPERVLAEEAGWYAALMSRYTDHHRFLVHMSSYVVVTWWLVICHTATAGVEAQPRTAMVVCTL